MEAGCGVESGFEVNLEKTKMMVTGGRWRMLLKWGGIHVKCVVVGLVLTLSVWNTCSPSKPYT